VPLQDRIVDYIKKQDKNGITISQNLKALRAYKNPDFLQHSVEHDKVEQYGTCYPPVIFDPCNLPKEDYYERCALLKLLSQNRRHRPCYKTEPGGGGAINFFRDRRCNNPLQRGSIQITYIATLKRAEKLNCDEFESTESSEYHIVCSLETIAICSKHCRVHEAECLNFILTPFCQPVSSVAKNSGIVVQELIIFFKEGPFSGVGRSYLRMSLFMPRKAPELSYRHKYWTLCCRLKLQWEQFDEQRKKTRQRPEFVRGGTETVRVATAGLNNSAMVAQAKATAAARASKWDSSARR